MLLAGFPPELQHWAAVPPRSAAHGGRPTSITVRSKAPEGLAMAIELLLPVGSTCFADHLK